MTPHSRLIARLARCAADLQHAHHEALELDLPEATADIRAAAVKVASAIGAANLGAWREEQRR
jgi:hypothetical protein